MPWKKTLPMCFHNVNQTNNILKVREEGERKLKLIYDEF